MKLLAATALAALAAPPASAARITGGGDLRVADALAAKRTTPMGYLNEFVRLPGACVCAPAAGRGGREVGARRRKHRGSPAHAP